MLSLNVNAQHNSYSSYYSNTMLVGQPDGDGHFGYSSNGVQKFPTYIKLDKERLVIANMYDKLIIQLQFLSKKPVSLVGVSSINKHYYGVDQDGSGTTYSVNLLYVKNILQTITVSTGLSSNMWMITHN